MILLLSLPVDEHPKRIKLRNDTKQNPRKKSFRKKSFFQQWKLARKRIAWLQRGEKLLDVGNKLLSAAYPRLFN